MIATTDVVCLFRSEYIGQASHSADETCLLPGLQCHTAPFTWKLIFEFNHRLYEFILSACSTKEEEEWRSHLAERFTAADGDLAEGHSNIHELFLSLSVEMKPIGVCFGPNSTINRRTFTQRTATLGPKTNVQH